MPAAKKPVPYCAHNNPQEVDDGTMCRASTPPPVPVGTGAAGPGARTQAGNAPFTPSGPSIASRIRAAPNWSELQHWSETALGPAGFSLGVCWGILASAGSSALDLLDLLKTFVLAGLYERAQQPLGWWDVADLPGQLAARAAQSAFGTELKQAHDQCEALLAELLYAVTHPRELFGSIAGQYVAKWKRFEQLSGEISLRGQFEAGKIAGEVLVDVVMLIGVGEAAVKLAAKLPELARLAETIGDSLRLGSKAGVGGGAVVEEAEAAAADAGRSTVRRSRVPRQPPPITEIPAGQAPEAVAAWYKHNPRITDENVGTYLKGTDFSKPVLKRPLNPGHRLEVWVRDGGKPGVHFAEPGTDPRTLGIDLEGRHREVWEVTEKIDVMETTAADFPEGEVPGVGGQGGGRQLITSPGATKFMRRISP